MILISFDLVWDSCYNIRESGLLASGVYIIKPYALSAINFPVFCDLTTDNHSWIVIQRRNNNSTSFDRTWNEYKRGFGSLTGNFWLGLENVHEITSRKRNAILRIELRLHEDSATIRYAEYRLFIVDNEASQYRLTIGNYDARSTLPNSMTPTGWGGPTANLNGMAFSTFDMPNTDGTTKSCAAKCHGGWWFNRCYDAYLNGIYHHPSVVIGCEDFNVGQKYMTWAGLQVCNGGISSSEMKVRYQQSQLST